jgi:hypothetical protein
MSEKLEINPYGNSLDVLKDILRSLKSQLTLVEQVLIKRMAAKEGGIRDIEILANGEVLKLEIEIATLENRIAYLETQ